MSSVDAEIQSVSTKEKLQETATSTSEIEVQGSTNMTATITETQSNERLGYETSSKMSDPASGGLSASSQNKANETAQMVKLTSQSTRRERRRLAQFYQDKNILITGATGFIGKVCLVKIVKSLGNCGKIYVMLRAKKGMTPQQRFNKMLNEHPFTIMESSFREPNFEGKDNKCITSSTGQQIDWSKVVAVDGDMSCEDLGLADDVKEEVCKSVNIIFNIAASVQFDAPLKQNLRDNYLGCRNILKLATKFENLKSFLHVSTFFTNSHISHVEEKIIPMNRDCEKMAELIQWVPDSLCDSMAPQIMEDRPNTYIFTKAMAENLVKKYQGRLPIAIVRPSIVVPSIAEPIPGWVDNVNGPMGLGTLASIGILRNIDWNYYGVCDFIPVDTVVNSMLAIAERTSRLYPNEIKVYNCSSSSLKPITWGEGFEILRAESIKSPPYKMLRIPIEVPRHRRANKIGFAMTKLSEILFAYLIDFILMLFGQKQLLTKLTSKLHHGYEILRPFTTTEYTCSNENIVAAYEDLDDEDKKEFDFDIRGIDWKQFFVDSYYGTRKKLLKEDMSNVSAARLKMRILQVLGTIIHLTFYGYIGWSVARIYMYYAA